MTTINTEHLRELAEAATPGPWEAKDISDDDTPWWWVWRAGFANYAAVGEMNVPSGLPADAEIDARGIISAEASDQKSPPQEKADAEYIAAADPQTLVALLDELEGVKRHVRLALEDAAGLRGLYRDAANERDALQARLDAALAYIDDPGNWGTYDGRRRLLHDLLSTPTENGEEQ